MQCAFLSAKIIYSIQLPQSRGVARGGLAGPPEFDRSVNPIQTKGGRLCPSHYCQPPPGFKKLSTSLKSHN